MFQLSAISPPITAEQLRDAIRRTPAGRSRRGRQRHYTPEQADERALTLVNLVTHPEHVEDHAKEVSRGSDSENRNSKRPVKPRFFHSSSPPVDLLNDKNVKNSRNERDSSGLHIEDEHVYSESQETRPRHDDTSIEQNSRKTMHNKNSRRKRRLPHGELQLVNREMLNDQEAEQVRLSDFLRYPCNVFFSLPLTAGATQPIPYEHTRRPYPN